MTFALPWLLALLALVPLLIAGYLALARRRTRRAAALADQGFAPNAAALRLRRRRHVPPAFFLAALSLALFALSRPQMRVTLPRREGTVILAFDVSNSMRATDLKPTRIQAAKVAARAFVAKQPSSVRIGIVAFSAGGVVMQPPTTSKSSVLAAITRLTPQGATSLGQGIFTSLSAIAGKPIVVDPALLEGTTEEAKIGYYGPAAIVLLSDGENTANPDPVVIAKLASVAGVTIHAVGIGTAEGTVLPIDGFSVATALDESGLAAIAKAANGRYFRAENARELAAVYSSIDLQWKSVSKLREVTGAAAGASVALLAVGSLLSMRWFGRMV